MSERDPEQVRDSLVRFATETTVGVRPGVGDNLAAYQREQKGLHFVQATVYREDPTEYIGRMAAKGYCVIMDISESRKSLILEALHKLGY